MKIHAAHLTGPPDGPVALLVPPDPDCDVCDGTGSWFDQDRIEPNPCTCTHPDWVAVAQPCDCNDGVRPIDHDPDTCGPVCHRKHDFCDCIDGLPPVELIYPCPHCSHCYDDDCAECETCCPEGDVSAGVGTITLVPVQNESSNQTDSIWDRGDGTFWLVLDDSEGKEPPIGLPITSDLPPDVKPGDTVAIWTAAEEPS